MDLSPRAALAAIERDEFHLVYQPIVDLDTGLTAGLEALVRWTHPVHGALEPAGFIGEFERNGAIADLGVWVASRAMTEASQWHRAERAAGRELYLSVNVSGYELQQPKYAAALVSICADFEHRCRELRVEIIESDFDLSGAQVAANLIELRAQEVKVLIDDFGAGASTVNRTSEVQADGIKIDRGLVSRITTDDEQLARLIGIHAEATAVGMEVIVEGVETEAQATLLRTHGFAFGQGFLYSRPVPAELVGALLAAAR